MKFTKDNLSDIKVALKASLDLISRYQWLIDLYVLDFFVDNHWTTISANWRAFIDQADTQDLAYMLDLEGQLSWPSNKVWPLEILCLKASIKAYSLDRRPLEKHELSDLLDLEGQHKGQWPSDFKEAFNELHHVFRKHIKPKKEHEIVRMSQTALMMSIKAKDSITRVDIGAGQGHLSRLLAFAYNFNVVCMDAEDDFSKAALQFDSDLIKAKKAKADTKASEAQKPQHVTLRIDPDLAAEVFDSKLELDNIGLIGLHTCGDLGPSILKLFCSSTKATNVQSVGCCYMYIKETFPLSKAIKANFNYTTLELACHAIETYKDRLKAKNEVQKLKVHNKRAILEWLINAKRPEFRHTALKTVKRAHELAFADYALKATAHLGLFEPEELDTEKIRQMESEWWRVVAFYTLRLLFGPLLETVLLLDRGLYLLEQGHESLLVPIFDPRLSPRNFVLLSHKK